MHTVIRVSVVSGLALLLATAIVTACKAAGTGAPAVAMITDVEGKATLSAQGSPLDLSVLAEVTESSQVELAQKARLVALWLRSGEEFSFSGPALIRFNAAGPQILSGPQPSRRPSALEKSPNIRIPPRGVAQAAIVMRSAGKATRIRVLSLAGTRTLDTNPEFRWQPIPSVQQYRFELFDVSGRALVELDVAGSTYQLPPAIKLEEGMRYAWDVSARLPDGRKYASGGEFSVATSKEREQVESIRPSATASVAERVAFAVWLDQQELRDEARKYWKDAAAERPVDAKLRQLAGE